MAILLTTLFSLSMIIPVFAASVGNPDQYNFIAGQSIDIGRVEVYNDATNLYITLIIEDPNWEVTISHVAVATNLASIPQTSNGNPKIGQFAYTDLLSYTIPLSTVLPEGAKAGDTLYIAVHAVVIGVGGIYLGQVQTAWGEACEHTGTLGGVFSGNSWATYILYTVT